MKNKSVNKSDIFFFLLNNIFREMIRIWFEFDLNLWIEAWLRAFEINVRVYWVNENAFWLDEECVWNEGILRIFVKKKRKESYYFFLSLSPNHARFNRNNFCTCVLIFMTKWYSWYQISRTIAENTTDENFKLCFQTMERQIFSRGKSSLFHAGNPWKIREHGEEWRMTGNAKPNYRTSFP